MYKASENDIKHTINDFLAFCSFIDEKAPILSKKGLVLGKKDLFELNKQLHYKKEIAAANYMQESYPVIDLMFKLALSGELYKKGADDKGNVYLLKTERKNEFDELTIYEKFVFLLETFYIKMDMTKMIVFEPAIYHIRNMIREIAASEPGEKLLKGDFSKEQYMDFAFSYYAVIVHYLSFFGLCEYIPIIDERKKLNRYDDTIAAVIPTEFGSKLCKALKNQDILGWNIPWLKLSAEIKTKKTEMIYNNRKKSGDVPLFNFLQNIFPKGELNRTVTFKITNISKGTYIFKVSLKAGVWRKIAVSHKHTLDDLQYMIQNAFDFDNDHLYAFCMEGTRYSKEVYYSPMSDDYPCAGDAVLEELGLYPGQRILYIFDFGDNWQFDVLLVKIDEDMELPSNPYVIESKGTAPQQYWFEEDDDDDDDDDEEEEE